MRPGPAPGLFISGGRYARDRPWTARPCDGLLSYFCALQHKLWQQHRSDHIYLGIRVIVVAVSPNTVTFEDLSRRAGVTRDSLSNFLAGFTRLKSPAR